VLEHELAALVARGAGTVENRTRRYL
jgi:hypothetical protein